MKRDKNTVAFCVDKDLVNIYKHALELYEALKKAQQDINWMLNAQKFLNPDVFDYIEQLLSKVS